MGVASYLRVEHEDGMVTCTLVKAKAKLAPSQQLTIPRLELSAAVLAAEQDCKLRQELGADIKLDESCFWTDSTIVLRYLKNRERRFLVFVANRVQAIRGRTKVSSWRHVRSEHNPADAASRGVEARALGSDLWQHGPEFLRLPEESWPVLELLPDLAGDDAEIKSSGRGGGQAAVNAAMATPKGEAEGPLEFLIARNSSWDRLLRVTARLLSVKDKWRRGVPMPKVMEPSHLRAAEVALCKHQQGEYFARELRAVQAGKPIQENSPLRELRPVADDGLLRMSGWIVSDLLE